MLRAVNRLGLPDCWTGAGFVRNLVWDRLHGYAEATPLNDIDVLYFDPSDRSRATERALEARLRRALPGQPWSVRNQARMHRRNADAPYRSTLPRPELLGRDPDRRRGRPARHTGGGHPRPSEPTI